MKIVAGKKALVTGAASGIGRAIACALAREQVELCLLDVDGPGLESLAAQLRGTGATVLAWQCDLADRGDLDARLDDLLLRWRGVDIVLNVAGRVYCGPTDLMSDDQWESLISVNLLAPAHIVRRLLPSLKERGDGHIVNIASIAGLAGFKRFAVYCLTKFGLMGFSEALRCELGKHGVGVTAVCPGFVRTPLLHTTMTADGRPVRRPWDWLCTSPEAVADRVIKAIRKNQSLVVITHAAHFLWWFKRLSPRLYLAVMSGWHRRRKPVSPSLAVDAASPRRAAA